ncbi:hypothetical protein DMN91_005503 [Ooceraea biroi]|uniref:Uncharacterized protein n=1 Tax=Ooceraea biroi TaxID=2015173 RepID=A0A3L8DL16_OOCBI|nr:hypothetical protein DMN91_005503 [Ooceraea biroi]
MPSLLASKERDGQMAMAAKGQVVIGISPVCLMKHDEFELAEVHLKFDFQINKPSHYGISDSIHFKHAIVRSGRTSWVLQEDNDPKHRSKLCSAWKQQNNVTTMEWPAMSPDVNPSENVLSYMKMKLKGKPVYTVKQLSFQIKKIWRSLPNEYAENLVGSMEKRCTAIISMEPARIPAVVPEPARIPAVVPEPARILALVPEPQDLYTLPCESYLYIDGTFSVDGAAAEGDAQAAPVAPGESQTHLVNNCAAFLFDELRYELNGVEIDRSRNVGVTSTLKNYVSLTYARSNILLSAG